MILYCSYEELRALDEGAAYLVGERAADSGTAVAAPAVDRSAVEALRDSLDGDLEIITLAEQRAVRAAVSTICESLRLQLDAEVLESHPAHETAVDLYFSYAHARKVLARLDRMGAEMGALVELITGAPVSDESARGVTFSD